LPADRDRLIQETVAAQSQPGSLRPETVRAL
jgi:hypothetical protein